MNIPLQKIYIYLFIILSVTSAFSQEKPPLLDVGGEYLSSDDFVKRFELTPRIRSSTDIDSQKVHFLLSLAAEKLWAEEAYSKNLDTLTSLKEYIVNLEKLLVRDKLFEKEVLSKVEVTESEINEAIEKRSRILRLKFLFERDKGVIDSLYNLLQTGSSIDSLLVGRPEAAEQAEPIEVSFGQMNKTLEDTVFSLRPGEYTAPIFNEIGWVVYYLENIKYDPIDEPQKKAETFHEVKKIIENRKKQALTENYLDSFLNKTRVNVDRELFDLLAEEIHTLLEKNYDTSSSKVFYLYENDFRLIENTLNDSILSSDFVKFESNPVSLSQFIYYLSFNNFTAPGKSKRSVRAALNNVTKEFIKLELLSREAFNRGYDALPEIRNELKIWKDNYLAQYLRNTYNDSVVVSQQQLDKYISENIDSTFSTKLAKVNRIRANDLDEVEAIFNLLNNGAEFERLSDSGADENKLKPLSDYGSLAEIINELDEGEIYGPIKKENGYLILKVEEIVTREISKDELNKLQADQLKEKLYYKNLSSILDEKTAEFAEKYNLKINGEILKNIHVTEIPTLVYRYYGFGGKTLAAPFINLFYKWFFKWKSGEKISL